MTPQFTTPCYVRIEDADKRKEVCKKLEDMGYAVYLSATLDTFYWLCTYAVDDGEYDPYVLGECFEDAPEHLTDCGTNTELFLAIAGMRSDTYKGQWCIAQANIMFKKLKGEAVTASKKRYISIGEMFMPLLHNLRFTWFGGNSKQLFRRATTAEIVEHFKKQIK